MHPLLLSLPVAALTVSAHQNGTLKLENSNQTRLTYLAFLFYNIHMKLSLHFGILSGLAVQMYCFSLPFIAVSLL